VKQAALEHGLPLYQPANYKDPAVLDEMRALKADLMVMAYVIIFIPEAARSIPTHGSICFHPSLLPLHRGPSSINWPIIGGATKTGLTYFWPDDGLDEGDILLQKEAPFGPDDTLGTVYFDKIFPLGVKATLEAIDLVRAGNPPRLKQDESKATYESWCKKENARIDWSKPAAEVYNLIRGANPQPGAWTVIDGTEVQVYDAARLDGEGRPGEVVGVSPDGIAVQAQGGRVLLKRVKPKAGEKQDAARWAETVGLAGGASAQ
jgi:methionyl-tRNA formyltransferase